MTTTATYRSTGGPATERYQQVVIEGVSPSIDGGRHPVKGIVGGTVNVIFLAEAFTRPPMMQALAKRGFTQSYTYFTWRNTKAEELRIGGDESTPRGRPAVVQSVLSNHPAPVSRVSCQRQCNSSTDENSLFCRGGDDV